MAYKGQPFPSTVHHTYRAKVSDGKSVRVTVPENTEIEAGKLYELDGFLGFAMESVKTEAGETKDVALLIEQAEYETDQISTSQPFAVGTKIYWNPSTKKLTETAESGDAEPVPYRPAGRVTSGKDANNVIWFILGPQV